jgi:chromate transport protein ChrA
VKWPQRNEVHTKVHVVFGRMISTLLRIMVCIILCVILKSVQDWSCLPVCATHEIHLATQYASYVMVLKNIWQFLHKQEDKNHKTQHILPTIKFIYIDIYVEINFIFSFKYTVFTAWGWSVRPKHVACSDGNYTNCCGWRYAFIRS